MNLSKLAYPFFFATVDSDASAYFEAVAATGVTLSSAQKTAFDAFVKECKLAGVWRKFAALYPMMGSSAAAHAINAKTPGTYNIVWMGTLTHSISGVLGDGATGYGDTQLVPGSVLPLMGEGVSMGCYSRTNLTGQYIDMGLRAQVSPSVLDNVLQIYSGYLQGRLGSGTPSVTCADTRGFFCVSRSQVGSGETYLYKDGNAVASATETTKALYAYSVYLAALNLMGTSFVRPSKREYALAFIAVGLNAAENLALYTAVQSLQTALARNI